MHKPFCLSWFDFSVEIEDNCKVNVSFAFLLHFGFNLGLMFLDSFSCGNMVSLGMILRLTWLAFVGATLVMIGAAASVALVGVIAYISLSKKG
jgi:hypothetical protein